MVTGSSTAVMIAVSSPVIRQLRSTSTPTGKSEDGNLTTKAMQDQPGTK